jgi:ferric-dicitrate binding protein FerR (iron transport regulator)
MSDEQKTNGEEQIAALLQMAGPRPRISEEARNRVWKAVHGEWQQHNVTRSRARVMGWSAASLAAAAAIVFVIVRRGDVQPSTPVMPAQLVAVARKIDGGVIAKTLAEAGAPHLLDIDTPVHAGDTVETSTGATAAFDWSGGSLRVAENTRFRFDTPRTLTLTRGTIYFASAPGSRSVEVRTPFGVIHDIGTQFEVRMAEDAVRIRVREGRIDLSRQSAHHTADAGTELFARSEGDVKRSSIPRSGADWDWVTRAAPPMSLNGNVQQLLGQITREKGLSLLVTDQSIASMTMRGNVPLGPDEALDAVAAASGLRYRIANETLFVERKR